MVSGITIRKRPLLPRRKGKRILHICVERDRTRVTALRDQVTALVEPTLADTVHGWRKGHSPKTAAAHIRSEMDGRPLIVFDLRHFFESIDQRRMKAHLDKLAPNLWLECVRWTPDSGLSQGIAFTPALANLYLSSFDARWNSAETTLIRYCDNFALIGGDFATLGNQLAQIGLHYHTVEKAPTQFCGITL